MCTRTGIIRKLGLMGEKVEYEGSNIMSVGGEALNGKDGFTGDLNGAQFPPINGMGGNMNEVSKGLKDCLGKENNCHSGIVNTNSVDGIEAMNEVNDNATSNTEGVEEVNEKEEGVVKKAIVDSQKDGISGNNIATNSAAKKLVDIVNSFRLDNKLVNVPTGVTESRNDVVIFDDEIIELGSKKWNLTVCGQFIGCSMGFNEARYHIRRMWSRLGLRDIIAENGVFYFKFQDEEGIKEVINNGPWMVNNKPMVVQKWSIDMCLDKAEPKKIPVRVKMMNVLMEAWSVKGISSLASSIGKPVIIDEVTTKMYVTGVGRIGFARVLVEIDVEKGIKDKIEIMYKSKNVDTGSKKIVDVEYSWIPSICSQCKVFGHTYSYCKTKNKNMIDVDKVKENGNEFKVVHNRRYGRGGLIMNRRTDIQNGQKGKMWNKGRFGNVNNKWQQNNRFEYRRRRKNEGKEKDVHGGTNENSGTNVMSTNNEKASDGKKFTLLDSLVNEEELVPNTDQRKIVDEVLCKKKDINNMEMNGWSEDMKWYYRDKKELFDAAREIEENEDVLDENYGVENTVLWNEVEGVVSEHSNGNANSSSEMSEFQDYVNSIKVEDLHMRIPNGVKKGKVHLDSLTSLQIKRSFYQLAEELRKKVKESQNDVDMFPHDERVKEKRCVILKEYHEAIQDEYSLLCQKAKVEWLKEGDRNTAYFYKTIKERVHRGRMMTIRNEEGVRFENDEVSVQIVKHFEEFLGKSSQVQKLSCRNDIFLKKLTFEEALKMVRPISDSKIKNAMFEIEDSKAPGPDDYTSRFYKSAWSIVGKEVSQSVREFFVTGKLLGEVNVHSHFTCS
ncbi:RNA-directed DNA polymerase, eukaryota, reverse transcriptase zinc-binding domain protein [Tanacetum coccineum]